MPNIFDERGVTIQGIDEFTVSVVNEPETITYYILTNEIGAVLTDENGNQLTIRI